MFINTYDNDDLTIFNVHSFCCIVTFSYLCTKLMYEPEGITSPVPPKEGNRPSPQPSPSSPSSPVGGFRGIDSDFVPFALPKGERRGLRGDKSVLLPLALPQGRGGGSAIRMEMGK